MAVGVYVSRTLNRCNLYHYVSTYVWVKNGIFAILYSISVGNHPFLVQFLYISSGMGAYFIPRFFLWTSSTLAANSYRTSVSNIKSILLGYSTKLITKSKLSQCLASCFWIALEAIEQFMVFFSKYSSFDCKQRCFSSPDGCCIGLLYLAHIKPTRWKTMCILRISVLLLHL